MGFSIKPTRTITKDQVLNTFSELEIYIHYCGRQTKMNSTFTSPLHSDAKPSFGLFRGSSADVLFFKDFTLGESGDCFKLVSLLFNIPYYESVEKVWTDMNGEGIVVPMNKVKNVFDKIKARVSTFFEIDTSVNYSKQDKNTAFYNYFKAYGINENILQRFNVSRIDSYAYQRQGNQIQCYPDDLMFCYKEKKDSLNYVKVCRPNSNPISKWFTNCNSSVHQGYILLPLKGDSLIITKSLKDVMSIYATLGMPAIGLQAESVNINPVVLTEYETRFKKVYCLFDNDFDKSRNWGQINAIKFTKDTNMVNLVIPDKWKSSDYSDLIKNHGINQAKQILIDLIKNNGY